jgi:hypothetical protein
MFNTPGMMESLLVTIREEIGSARDQACGAICWLSFADEIRVPLVEQYQVIEPLVSVLDFDCQVRKCFFIIIIVDSIKFSSHFLAMTSSENMLFKKKYFIFFFFVCFFVFCFFKKKTQQGRMYASGALWGLSIHTENKLTMAEDENLINAFIKIVKSEPQNKVLNYVSLALQNLAVAEENRSMLVSEYKLHAALMHVFKTDMAGVAVEGSLQAIRFLAMEPKNRKAMVRQWIHEASKKKKNPFLFFFSIMFCFLFFLSKNLQNEEPGLVARLQEIMSDAPGKARQFSAAAYGFLKDLAGPTTSRDTQNQGDEPEDEGTPAQARRKSADGAPNAPATAPQRKASVTGEKPQPEPEEDELVAQENVRHCTRVMKELVDSERVYVNGLKNLKEVCFNLICLSIGWFIAQIDWWCVVGFSPQHFEVPLAALKNAAQLQVNEIFRDIGPILVTHNELFTRASDIINSAPREDWPTMFADTLIQMVCYFS